MFSILSIFKATLLRFPVTAEAALHCDATTIPYGEGVPVWICGAILPPNNSACKQRNLILVTFEWRTFFLLCYAPSMASGKLKIRLLRGFSTVGPFFFF